MKDPVRTMAKRKRDADEDMQFLKTLLAATEKELSIAKRERDEARVKGVSDLRRALTVAEAWKELS